MIIKFSTHKHVGDHVICTGAVRNVRLEHPEIKFVLPDMHGEIFANNPDFTHEISYREIPRVTYGKVYDEQRGTWGTCVEGFTRSLCELLNIPLVPIRVNHPVLVLNEYEKEWAGQWNDCILLNGNFQTCGVSKGYPHWQDVVDGLGDVRIIQIGGNESRDISPNLRGVEDMRGKTTLRQLIAMAYGCRCIVSPPSCISNIGGAFGKPQVVVNASREPDALTKYENVRFVSHKCDCGWGVDNGCVALRILFGTRCCPHTVRKDGLDWCKCQYETPPADVVKAVLEVYNCNQIV